MMNIFQICGGGMSCFNNDGFAFEGLTKIVNGVGFVYFNLTSLFESFDNINVFGFMDNDNVSMILNKNVSININIFSSALDLSTFNFMNYVLDIPMVDNTSWITVAWRQISLYCGFIDVIVNGCVVNSINISNAGYQAFKNQDFSPNFFEAMKMFNIFFASSKEGVFEPNYYLMDFIRENNLDSRSLNEIKDYILIYLKLNYGISSDECVFIKQYCSGFVDVIAVGVDYHGDISPNIELDVGGGLTKLNGLPSSFAVRQSNIYYDNIRDSDGFSVGYEGMRSFAIANDNVTNSDLSHWLSLNSTFPVGLMKASYGTFLTSLLVIYEHDRIADLSAGRFNVVWKRVAPVCVSLCNDYNCLYITGESDHGMGMEVCGNSTDVWNFRFACSFSFSLIEQLVGNNVWNDTTIGSVTLGLFKSYFDGESLEMIYSNGYVIFKRVGDNTTLLFLDSSTGIVRDVFSYLGILGTMPCYHDYITDNAVSYAYLLMNLTSQAYKDLMKIFDLSNILLNITEFYINKTIAETLDNVTYFIECLWPIINSPESLTNFIWDYFHLNNTGWNENFVKFSLEFGISSLVQMVGMKLTFDGIALIGFGEFFEKIAGIGLLSGGLFLIFWSNNGFKENNSDEGVIFTIVDFISGIATKGTVKYVSKVGNINPTWDRMGNSLRLFEELINNFYNSIGDTFKWIYDYFKENNVFNISLTI